MNVFQLNTFCGVKSTGRIACEIAKLVEADGGRCQIGYGVPGISADSEPFAYRIGTKIERKIHAALRKLFDAEGYGGFFATQKLIRQIKKFNPDLIHLHNLHGCYLHLPLLFRFLKQIDVPVVWTLHDCWPFTGHCAYFDFCGCNKWIKGCFDCPQQSSYPVCIGLDGSKRNYRMKQKAFTGLKKLTFVAPCHWMTEPLSHSFLAAHSVRVIPNGVNRSVFHPTKNNLRERYHLQHKKIALAVAAEWDDRKGLKFILQAAERLCEKFVFVVIGLDKNQMTDLPSNVIALEHTADTQELAAWYTTADCLVNPTLEDNMPMVNLEALACGTPVAVFETGGCPEAVNSHCGCVVQQGDINLLINAILQLTESKNEMGESCLQQAENFDCTKTFRSYLELYKELCS